MYVHTFIEEKIFQNINSVHFLCGQIIDDLNFCFNIFANYLKFFIVTMYYIYKKMLTIKGKNSNFWKTRKASVCQLYLPDL